jgi:hypothetical protein
MNDVDAAYIAGLFDGEGSVYYKLTKRKRHDRPGKPVHNTWVIRMEIAMTDQSILIWLWETLGCGKVGPRKVKPGKKPQWRWRCSHRDAYHVCKVIWPFVHVKLEKINQIIAHYSVTKLDNVVYLNNYKDKKYEV